MTTDNPVLLRKHIALPTLMCAQRRAEKRVSTEEDFIKSNTESFGNGIGRITNYITSMFEVRSRFDPSSEEYKTLTYRIKCGQQLQQNEIDKAKGIISKPMPRYWYDKHAIAKLDDEEQRSLCYSIVADKKPYFMKYVYPNLMKQYNTYIKASERSCICEFKMTLGELRSIPTEELTDQQKSFLFYHEKGIPVGVGDCIMNKICRRIESEFDGFVGRYGAVSNFKYDFMRSKASYTEKQYKSIDELRKQFNDKLASYCKAATSERQGEEDSLNSLSSLSDDFEKKCFDECSNSSTLCDIILDVCYTKTCTKKFAWSMCGENIVSNLLEKNEWNISYPTKDSDGDIYYNGERYRMNTMKLGESNEFNNEGV